MKAIILAAGRGNRLRPLTDTTPKTLLPIKEKPILEYVLESLPDSIDEVFIVADHHKDQVEIFAKQYSTDSRPITVVDQQKDSRGTMTALLSVKDYLKDERFLVISGDDIHLKKNLEEIIKHERAFGVEKMYMPGYHAIRENNGYLSHFEPGVYEEKIPVANGVYVLDTNIFKIEPTVLRDGEIGLPQTILKYKDEYPVKYLETTGWIPINTPQDLEDAKGLL